ncbi:MAG TPA: Amuc_1102 family pilus-like protein [Chthoniobacterales bacterium]|nr:Amuc_1102 family pilus-like protein [Chthoniobacterales bacterium]
MRARVRFIFFVFSILALAIQAQVRAPAGREFQITKIFKNLIPTPDYGIGQYRPAANERWLEVEVEFISALERTDELTLKYYVLFNGRLLTGEVTHTNISAGLNRSVMYVLPVALARFAGNKPVLPNIFQNVAVQIVQGGAVKDELSLARAPSQWFAALPPISGFVLNKNETPFAPLYWDRYAQIKTR